MSIDEFLTFISKRHPNATASSLKMFVVSRPCVGELVCCGITLCLLVFVVWFITRCLLQTSDMGSLISVDSKNMLLKDIKTFLDKEAGVTSKHILELAALDKKKAKLQEEREEMAANGGKKPTHSLMKSVGKFFGFSKKAAHASVSSPDDRSRQNSTASNNSTDMNVSVKSDSNEPFAQMK
jgi:hypothetical protein